MAKFGGFGGGNMQQILRQAQQMQQKVAKAQEELAATEIIGSASGMVEGSMMGDRRGNSVKINPQAVDPDDIEMLEDLVAAAVGDALKKVEEASEKIMGPLTGGMGGMF